MSGFDPCRRLAALILVLSISGPMAAAPALAGPLERTEPGHLAPPQPGAQLPFAPPIVQFALPPQWMTIRSKEDWRKAGTFEKELSKDCAALRFGEITPMRFRAYFNGQVMGVAFGHGLNLHDPGKKADPKKIYLFRNGDSAGCTVQSMDNKDPRVNPAAGQAATPAGGGFKKY
ncbi:hypothetical protein VY88_06470 [Azospirillum thiophilum]|uniref:Beta/gamma crystallin 'Greek key' domain-containing protein n=1 Tax=Azospirillum thiophilum TaxID=528244 RepID=A0AAC8VWE6_9PROT|nr:hypothetical protein [Azospirillum thiophilum]ALG70577.1 hypothetical protein AL072_06240 [Azospirillum thiophilum]KJR65751.1 hypothetical protein VY88_06470 [Azospirillum thiophilum]